eukprot:3499266-Rhodomonas_salina.1
MATPRCCCCGFKRNDITTLQHKRHETFRVTFGGVTCCFFFFFFSQDFISVVYGRLGLDYELHLSTRPEKFVGTIEQWDNAELHLQRALNVRCPI